MNSSVRHKKFLKVTVLASLALLLVVLTTGCGQNPRVSAKTNATPTPGGPIMEPTLPPAPTIAASIASAPTITAEQLAAGKKVLITMGCVGCHTIDTIPEALGIVGPNLTHIATRAADTITTDLYKSTGTTTTVSEYLQESIFTPSTYLSLECPTGPCPDFVMPRDFKTRISADDLTALLDLFSSLK